MIDEDRFGYYEEVDGEEDDGEQVDDEQVDEELCYQTPSRWILPLRDNVLKHAKSIIAYTLNVLSERGKGPITSSEKDDVERITSMGLEVVERAYDIYIRASVRLSNCSPLIHRIRKSREYISCNGLTMTVKLGELNVCISVIASIIIVWF